MGYIFGNSVLDASASNIVSAWPVNEASGTRFDVIASNDLTDNNTVTQATGKNNTAASFASATLENLSISDTNQSGLDFNSAFTVVFWLQPDSITPANVKHIFSKWNTTGDQRTCLISQKTIGSIAIQLSPDGTAGSLFLMDTDGDNDETATNIMLAGFNMVALRYNPSTELALWLGTSSALSKHTKVTSVPASLHNGTAAFLLGGREAGGATTYFDGEIDEAVVWNSLLTDAQITALYNSGIGRFLGLNPPFDTITKVGFHAWRYAWSATTGPYKIYNRGRLIKTTTLLEYTIDRVGTKDEPTQLEIFDNNDVSVPLNLENNPRAILQWRGKTTANHYRIEESIDSVFTLRQRVREVGKGYYRFETMSLSDVTTHNFRVIAVDRFATQGTALAFEIFTVRNPDPPVIRIAYSETTNNLTVSAN